MGDGRPGGARCRSGRTDQRPGIRALWAQAGDLPSDVAGAELGRLLDERGAMLLVVDDVWDAAQLRPFRFGGSACTRLVTTRVPDLLPEVGQRILVDSMSAGQARELVAYGMASLSVGAPDRLASVAGRWPVLLNLVNGVLRRVRRRLP